MLRPYDTSLRRCRGIDIDCLCQLTRTSKIILHTPHTISDALAWATDQLRATSDTPRLDAELLLAHVLGWPRARLLAERRAALPDEQRSAFSALVVRRRALEPVAYLVGHKEFYGLDFLVDRRVLVPRPETELLVELALGFARWGDGAMERWGDGAMEGNEVARSPTRPLAHSPAAPSSLVIADVGTGSGCIAVALAVHLPDAAVVAIDRSPDALDVARQNVARHGVADRVSLLQGDLLARLGQPADLIVSNPPYTILDEIDAAVRRHEPHAALDGGADGLEVYRRLLTEAPGKLRPGGAVLLEIGATQAAAVSVLARQSFPGAEIQVHKDLAGRDRLVTIEDKEIE
jgi:release factor glutamine methyltransferase